MHVLVTGGAGFIGSHLCEALIEAGHKVTAIDNFSTGQASNLSNLKGESGFTLIEGSILEVQTLTPLINEADYVFHLAAESRIQPAIKNPSRAYNVNVIGTLNILELSRKYNIKRIMYSSTSSVYGLTNQLPTSEGTLIDCLNPYAHSKYTGEDLFRQYWKEYKVDSVVFRYFNVFGERSPIKGQYAPVVGIFLNQLKNNTDLTIVGAGLKKRDFIYVGDIVTANIDAMIYEGDLESKTINIGSGNNINIKEIANLISNNQVHIDNRPGEAENTLADITIAKKLLNFNPKTNVKDWIKSKI